MKRYRPNVAAILERADGRILIGERVGLPGAWQFPQGGVQEDETLLAALQRELHEEIGISPAAYEVMGMRSGYRYDFPTGVQILRNWAGQEQSYFHCRYLGTGEDGEFRLHGEHEEFSRVKWISPGEFQLAWLPEFKREVYRQVFQDMLGVPLA